MTTSPPTRWTLVQEAKGHTSEARQALSELCALYYAPIDSQMRRWLNGADEAQDVTQAFFAHLLEGRHLNGADAAKGRFRTYLHSAAHHFLVSHLRRRDAAKRGADRTLADSEALDALADIDHPAPDAEFDRAWACAVLQQALDHLETEMAEQKRTALFNALKPWLAGQASHGDTSQTAQALQTNETAVRVHLSRLRKRLRYHIETIVKASLCPGANPQDELAALVSAFQ